MSDITRWDMEPGWDGFMVADSIGKYVLFTDHEAALSALTESRDKAEAENMTLKVENKNLNDTVDAYAIVCRGHSGILSGIYSLRQRADKAEARVKELEQIISLGCQDSESVCPYWQNMKDFETENEKLTAERDRLRKAVDLLIDFIPDGWEMPLGYSQIVAQAKAALAEK